METNERKLESMRVVGVMTAPRYECVWARSTIQLAFRRCGLDLTVSGGAFYGQSMQKALQEAVNAEADFAVTVDFDSIITGEQVMELLNWVAIREDIDAIAAYQPHRSEQRPLLTLQNSKQSAFYWDKFNPIQVATAHFGLTVIRLAALKRVPKPWFWSKPDENGDWENNKIDDDIWFWRAWEAAGNTVYVQPSVRIGHMGEFVIGYDENLNLVYETQQTWRKRNAAALTGKSLCGSN